MNGWFVVKGTNVVNKGSWDAMQEKATKKSLTADDVGNSPAIDLKTTAKCRERPQNDFCMCF